MGEETPLPTFRKGSKMKVRNISVKIIGIAGDIIMPGDEKHIDDSEINESVRALENRGMLILIEEPAEVYVKAEVAKEEVKEEAVEEVKTTRGRKKKETA